MTLSCSTSRLPGQDSGFTGSISQVPKPLNYWGLGILLGDSDTGDNTRLCSPCICNNPGGPPTLEGDTEPQRGTQPALRQGSPWAGRVPAPGTEREAGGGGTPAPADSAQERLPSGGWKTGRSGVLGPRQGAAKGLCAARGETKGGRPGVCKAPQPAGGSLHPASLAENQTH